MHLMTLGAVSLTLIVCAGICNAFIEVASVVHALVIGAVVTSARVIDACTQRQAQISGTLQYVSNMDHVPGCRICMFPARNQLVL